MEERSRELMFLKTVLLWFMGLSFGGVIAAGIFAFLAIIGVYPRLIGVTRTRKHVMKNHSTFQPAFQDNSGKENLLTIQCGYNTRFLHEEPRLLQLIFCLLLRGKRYIPNTDICAP